MTAYPCKLFAGITVTDYVVFGNLAPTFLEIAGIEKPGSMRFNSILNVLLSKKSGQVRDDLKQVFSSIESHCGRYPMRAVQNEDFLYTRNYETERPVNLCKVYWEGESGYSPTWLEISRLDSSDPVYHRVAGKRPEEELYYLPDDPYQLNNLAGDP